MSSSLFSPINIGRMALKHKLVMAPMTRLRSLDHVPNGLVSEYYEQRASRPGSFIITEATSISAPAGGLPNAPGIYSSGQISAWKDVIDRIHQKDSYVFVQLWAQGRMAVPAVIRGEGYDYVSSSDIPQSKADGVNPRPLTKPEIDQYMEWYATAAKNAIAAGADGVELHGANAYLIDQFLHSCSNVRTDSYGGSIENRSRFALEAVDAVVGAIGADRTAIRLSPWNNTYGDMDYGISPIPQFSHLIAGLEERAIKGGKRLAYLHTVEGPTLVRNTFVRDIWTGSWIRSGDMLKDNRAETVVQQDDKVAVAVGRHFVSNPDLPDRLEAGIPLADFDFDTFYTQEAKGYTDYPFSQK